MWVIYYLVIPAGFVYAVGLIDVCSFISQNERNAELERKTRFSKEEYATLEFNPSTYAGYLDSLADLRRKQLAKNKIPDMNLYFRDLKQSEMFLACYHDSLNQSGPIGRTILEYVQSKKQEIVDISQSRSMAFSSDKRDRAAIEDIQKYRAVWFPKDIESEKNTKRLPWYFFIPIIVGWFVTFYLRGLFFAALLFLFWRKRLKQKTRVRLGIVSFISSVAIWPYVLFSDIKNRFSEFVSRTEVVSRRNAMLSLFSKQEQKLIEKSKEMTRAEFARYLDSIGMFRRHSLWLSFVVVVIISITPKTVLASTHVMNAKTIAFEKVFHVLDWDIGDTPCLHSEPEDVHVVILREIKKVFHIEIIAKLYKGYLRDIGGIPRFKVNFS